MDRVPADGDMDQVTLVLVEPVTVVVNVADCPPVSEADVGEIAIVTGAKEITAVSLFVESAALTAVTVTVCAEPMVAGAV